MKLNVIELAKKAGLEDWTDDGNWRGVDDDLIRFADLIIDAVAEVADCAYATDAVLATIREMKS